MSREERITVAEYPAALSLAVEDRLIPKFPDKLEVYLSVIFDARRSL